MAQRVYLHVGTPKSGTTYLQDTLWEHRRTLRSRGLLYPGRRPFDHNRASIDVRQGRHLAGLPERGAWARFCRQAADFDGTVVLSNEWYVEATGEQARAAVDQLGGDRVEVVVTTRGLVRLVPAAWQESLKIGRGHSLEEFVTRLDDPGVRWNWEVLDPARVARRWADVVGAGRVHVVTMPERSTVEGQLWQRFAQTVGLADRDLELPTRRANESLSVQAARLLQEVGPALRAEVDSHDSSWRGRARWLRNVVVRDVLTSVAGDPIGLGSELRHRLLERSAASVADLRELGCRVTGDLGELVEGTERDGSRNPGTVSPDELLDAATQLAVGLLRHRIEAAGEPAAETASDDGDDGDTDAALEHDVDDDEPVGHAPATPVSSGPEERTRRVTFMVPSAFYPGGIARTVFTVANTLAGRGYDVGILTLTRSAETPYFDLDPRIRITAMQDRFDPDRPETLRPRLRKDPTAPDETRELDRQPSQLADGAHRSFTAYVDARLEEELTALPPGVIVSTRPEFAVAAARWSDPRSILIHQEHLSFLPRPAALRGALRDLALGVDGQRRIDAMLTLTEADLERWREFLGDARVRTDVIPNPTPFEVGEPAPLSSKVVIAAGRLTAQKGFERLVEAYAPLARSHPDWQLRIYGTGQRHDDLARQLETLDVGDRILLAGVTNEFERELANASVYAMSSRFEGLPMVLLEALSKGVPPVSFDCPEGPRQLIDNERNGLLVPEGDVVALGAALRRVMDDEDLRRRLGAGALESARAYQADAVVDRWVGLIDEVDRSRRETGI